MSDLSDLPTAGKRSVGQFLAAGSVVLSLLFVGYEIRQNTTLARAQTRHEISMGVVDISMAEAGNPQLASIVRRGNAGEALTPDETAQYLRRTRAWFRYWENVHYQFRQGLYDDAEFAGHLASIGASMANPGLVAFWCRFGQTFSPEFRTEIDGFLTESAC